jgi:VanZ family protein
MPGTKRYSSAVTRWLPAVTIMVIIFVFSSIPSEEMPHFGGMDFFVKKLGHLAGYALLAFALLWGLGLQTPGAPLKAWLLAVVYAATDEFHQSFVPGRNASILDVGIDALGALVGILPVLMWRKTRTSPKTSGPA